MFTNNQFENSLEPSKEKYFLCRQFISRFIFHLIHSALILLVVSTNINLINRGEYMNRRTAFFKKNFTNTKRDKNWRHCSFKCLKNLKLNEDVTIREKKHCKLMMSRLMSSSLNKPLPNFEKVMNPVSVLFLKKLFQWTTGLCERNAFHTRQIASRQPLLVF